jgi:hypothetical protein
MIGSGIAVCTFPFSIWNPVHLVQGSTRWYVLVRASTYLTRYKAVRETSKWYIPARTNIENSYGSTIWYVLICTVYCLVPAQYKVQSGTRWYKMVQGGTNNGIWRYMEVQGRTRIVQIVQVGTYWHVLILTIQSGYAALLLDSLLHFCPADNAVLETTASNHTNASSRMFQSTAAGPASNLVTSPALIGGGCRQRRFFGGRGRFRRRGRRRCRDGSSSVSRGSMALALTSSEGTGMGPRVGWARKQSG